MQFTRGGGGGSNSKNPNPQWESLVMLGFLGFLKVFLETRFHLVMTRRIL